MAYTDFIAEVNFIFQEMLHHAIVILPPIQNKCHLSFLHKYLRVLKSSKYFTHCVFCALQTYRERNIKKRDRRNK